MLRSLAFYLPQFHPVPENDEWWGAGFTEWRNVARARPRFRGHEQPRLPGELGFYDLREPETRRRQAALAAEHGLSGFVFYHYWFSGRRILERPVQDVLADPEFDLPFCLCWANENWTRTWDGGDHEVLLEQRYSLEDDEAHFATLLQYMSDPRYIRHQERPVLLVHRATRLPHPQRTLATWRSRALEAGLPGLYLLRVENLAGESGDPAALGFDAAVEFQPNFANLPGSGRVRVRRDRLRPLQIRRGDRILSYPEVVDTMRRRHNPDYVRWPGVTPGWDNSPRRAKGALILRDSTPELFGEWVREAAARARAMSEDAFIFVNAWNEWAEGAVLEPDLTHGRAYLEAFARGLTDS